MRKQTDDWIDGLDLNGGTPRALAKTWLDVNWQFPAGAPAPLDFKVVVFTGADPTATANYLMDPITCLATDRRLVTSITPNTSVTNINAAVRADYPDGSSVWVPSSSGQSSSASGTDLGTQAGVNAAQGTANTALTNANNALTISAQFNSVDYLTNADKIKLRQQWDEEYQTRIQLINEANSTGLSGISMTPALYDAVVTAVSTTLTNAGAPSNWTSTWPDGTTFGPSVGIQNSLRNAWAQVAQYRQMLIAEISGKQSADAQAAAISSAATTAMQKADWLTGGLFDGSKISNATISDAKITGLAASKVTGQLTDAQLAAIAAAKLTGQITTTQISDNAISTPKLAAGAVTAAQIAADTITAAQIAANAITSAELAAGSVTAGKVAAGAVQAGNIAAGAIQAGDIAANTITGDRIAGGTITGNNLAAGTILAKNLTVLNFDNIFPNPNGVPPPTGYSSGLHYDHYRWGSADGGSPTGYSHTMNSAPGYEKGVGFNETDGTALQVKGGEVFYAEAKIYVSSAAGGAPGLYWFAKNAAGTLTGSGQVTAAGTAFNTYTMTLTVPANSATLSVYAFCPNTSQASITGLYLRRCADASVLVDGAVTAQKLQANAIQTTNYAEDGSGVPTAGAKLQVGGTAFKVEPSGLQIGATLFSSYMATRLAQAIDGNASNGRVLYRGNIDVTTRGGAPNIACLTVTRRRWDTTYRICRLELSILPSATSDNLDAMRFAKVDLYKQSVAGTSGTLTLVDTYYQPIADRRYGNFSSDWDSGNSGGGTFETTDSLISAGVPACIVTLYNAYGPSAGNCFYSSGTATYDGAVLTNNGTSFPAGLTGGSSGGSGGGGGGGGGACPAPWVKIQLASGLLVDAGDLYDGAVVVGVNDSTLQPAVGTVRGPRLVFEMRQAVILEDGRAPEFSVPHRLYVEGKGWTEVRNLQHGDSILGQQPSIVKALGAPFRGQVVQFMVEGCATYLSDGLLSHNLKPLTY